jgi:hypothetical protein
MERDFVDILGAGRLNALKSLGSRPRRGRKPGVPELFQNLDAKDVGELFARTQLRIRYRELAS